MQYPERFHNNPAPSQNKINFSLCPRGLAPKLSFSTQSQQERGTERGLQLQSLLLGPPFPFQGGLRVHFQVRSSSGCKEKVQLKKSQSKPRMRSFTKRLPQPLPSPSWEENRGFLGHCRAGGSRKAILCPGTNVLVLLSAALWPGELALGEPYITHCRCLASGGGNSPAFLTVSARSSVSKVHPDLRGLACSVGGNKAWA